jgi:hypothetical protein
MLSLNILELLHMFELVWIWNLFWIWIENPRENKIEKQLEIPGKRKTLIRPRSAQAGPAARPPTLSAVDLAPASPLPALTDLWSRPIGAAPS